jgi:hypothetical protein
MGLPFQRGLSELAQEEETGEEQEEPNIDEYMAKIWKSMAYGAMIQHM